VQLFALRPTLAASAALLSLCAAMPAHAGLYSDDLARCLVGATTTADKTNLVRWIFSNAALHPEVASITAISPEQRVEIDKTAAALLQKLLTQSCRQPYSNAIRYEGAAAMETSFGVLGQVAMKELMSNPAVNAGFGAFGQYVDQQAVKDAAQLPGDAAKPAGK